MGVQFGVLSRLTWWEYSWDIMEPVTYFVTYGTTMAMFAYYVLTKQVGPTSSSSHPSASSLCIMLSPQEYNYPDVRDREFLLTFHKAAKKEDFNVVEYNKLREAVSQAEYDLRRLRDPLQIHIPLQQLEKLKSPVDFKPWGGSLPLPTPNSALEKSLSSSFCISAWPTPQLFVELLHL